MRQKVSYMKKKIFCLISRFSWGMLGVSHTATCAMTPARNFKRVFLETRFFRTFFQKFSIFSFQILTTYFEHFEEKHVRIYRLVNLNNFYKQMTSLFFDQKWRFFFKHLPILQKTIFSQSRTCCSSYTYAD